MKQTALKISLYNGNYFDRDVEFDSEEVELIEKSIPAIMESQLSQTQAPNLMDVSRLSAESIDQTVQALVIHIRFRGMSSKMKTEQVVRHGNKMRVYYMYTFDPLVYFDCVADPNYVEEIVWGDYQRMIAKMVLYGC